MAVLNQGFCITIPAARNKTRPRENSSEVTGLSMTAIAVNAPPGMTATYRYPRLDVSLRPNVTAPSQVQIKQLV